MFVTFKLLEETATLWIRIPKWNENAIDLRPLSFSNVLFSLSRLKPWSEENRTWENKSALRSMRDYCQEEI